MISDHSDPLATMGGEEAGGQNIYVHQLGIHLVRKKIDVDVFTRLADPKLPEISISRDGGYRVVRIPAGPKKFIPKDDFLLYFDEFIAGIQAFIKKHDLHYDVIHTHYWLSGTAGLRLREELRLPVVHNFHSLGVVKHRAFELDNADTKRREEYEQKIVDRVDHIIATSPQEKRQLIHLCEAEKNRISVVPIGVDTTRFFPVPKKEAKRAIGIDPAELSLLYVGRFVEQKGLPVLLQAFAAVRRELPARTVKRLRLYLVGGNPNVDALPEQEKKQLQLMYELIEHYDLYDSVDFLGSFPNVKTAQYYNAADVCIVPSRYEPFGIVALEAMACATPLLVSHVGGLQFTVQNLHTGFHARVGDVADFAYKLKLLIENENLRAEFGKNGRERIAELFTWDTVTDGVIQVYNRMISAHEDEPPRQGA